MLRTTLIDLLKTLEAAVPPPTNCHHAITYARYGSDDAGWQDKLALQVNHGGLFHCFFLEDADVQEDSQRIVAHVVEALATPMPIEQLGVGLGQYKRS